MLATYASTALILGASLLLGSALLSLARWPRPAWLAGATGFAALVVIAPFAIRLPGRATTAAVLVGALCALAAVALWRDRGRAGGGGASWPVAIAVVALVLALATVPFVVNERVGVLGEGIYTNDHAAQLYWADWLRTGFGPEPSAVGFGYPVGPQAVAVIAAQVGGLSLVEAFNGLLLAIPALTALAALAGLGALPAGRRIAVAAAAGIPYLAASFLAQSAFKETAMGLFVLSFALALAALSAGDPAPRRGVVAVGSLLAAASVFTFSLPGLAWFAVALCAWVALEALAGRSPVGARRIGAALRDHRLAAALAGVAIVAARRGHDRPRRGLHRAHRRRPGLGRQARLAGLPRRGARDLAAGRLPDRPRGGGRGACSRPRSARSPPATAPGCWSAAGRRRCSRCWSRARWSTPARGCSPRSTSRPRRSR